MYMNLAFKGPGTPRICANPPPAQGVARRAAAPEPHQLRICGLSDTRPDSGGSQMPPNPELRSQERRRPPRTRETAEQRAIRIRLSSGRDNGATGRDNGASGRDNGAKSPGERLGCDLDSLVKGQRFTTAARTISAADVGSLSPAGDEASGTRSGGGAPAALVLSYALGPVPPADERIVSVRRRGDV